MAFFAHSRPVQDGVFGGAASIWFGDLLASVIAWNDKRITARELNKLSDRELDDIGLCRADIDDVVERLR